MFCKKCGGKLESYASNCAFCGAPVEKYDTKMEYIKQESNKQSTVHMTTWKWLGLDLLIFIPIIGHLIYLILMLKWAFGNNKNSILKGYARASLITILIVVALAIGLFFIIKNNPNLLEEIKKALKI